MSEWRKAWIIVFIFCITAAIMTPPDIVSQLTLVVIMVIIYGLLILFVSRFNSYAQTPESIKKLITILICLLSITLSCSVLSLSYYSRYHRLKAEHSKCLVSQQQTQIESQ